MIRTSFAQPFERTWMTRSHAAGSIRFAAAWLAFVAATASLASAADDIYPGDTAVIVKDKVELGLKDKMAIMLSKGDHLQVTEVRGKWIGGYATVDGKRYTGWVDRTEVKLLEPTPEDVAVIELPDKPDDAAAVAALKKLGVELELNDKGNVHSAVCTESEVGDKDLQHFKGLHQLSTLELSGRPITDEGMKALAGLNVLQDLYMEDAKITDESFATIKTMTNLEVLALPATKVKGPGLVHMLELASLRVLNLTDCEIDDDALKPLEKMPQLEVLAIPRTKVTSVGLAHLRPVVKLRVLNLIGCDVDDAGLEHLKGLANLRMLYVRDTKVTLDAIDAFKDEAPSLAIYDD
ncbi:MAG: hypothetical protein H8E44_17980 [Planctomycetes bacterium]|nr:hypothetical protein [Planctomycetota bacterium]MBL7040465.1 hypothetical protein [Pirellulaceae bacterium]